VAVLRVEGAAALFAAGRDLRATLAAGAEIDIGDQTPTGSEGRPLRLSMRPPRVR
jgi:hypothetical protein